MFRFQFDHWCPVSSLLPHWPHQLRVCKEIDPGASRAFLRGWDNNICFLRGWDNIWSVNLGDICYLCSSWLHPPTAARCTLAAYLEKIDCYWGFFLRNYISLDRFILFVIRSQCVPSPESQCRRLIHWNDLHEEKNYSEFSMAGKLKIGRKCSVREFFFASYKITLCYICCLSEANYIHSPVLDS